MRVLSATNADLDAEVAGGRFRQDLRFRLNTIEILVPPLRERREDIAPLAAVFLAQHVGRYRKAITGFEDAALRQLEQHPWPGNVRELDHAVERAVLMATGSRIAASDLLLATRNAGPQSPRRAEPRGDGGSPHPQGARPVRQRHRGRRGARPFPERHLPAHAEARDHRDVMKLGHDRRIQALALLSALPAIVVAFVLLLSSGWPPAARVLVALALLWATWRISEVLRQRVARPLQTLANVLGAMREGDFSFRAKLPEGDEILAWRLPRAERPLRAAPAGASRDDGGHGPPQGRHGRDRRRRLRLRRRAAAAPREPGRRDAPGKHAAIGSSE